MQYDVNTVEQYLAVLQDDWRKSLLYDIRQYILSNHNLNEDIEYKMLSYKLEDKSIFHLNAQKNYIGLYVGNIAKIDSDGSLVGHHDCGKGCVRLKKTYRLEEKLKSFIDKAVKMSLEGGDINC